MAAAAAAVAVVAVAAPAVRASLGRNGWGAILTDGGGVMDASVMLKPLLSRCVVGLAGGCVGVGGCID